MEFRIIHQDRWLVAVDKPAGFQVHQPEDPRHRVSRTFDCLSLLRRQTGQYLYPVHRLDRATSGVLLFAFDAEAARLASLSFSERRVKKTYYCVTRGWTRDEGTIDHPLASGEPAVSKESRTRFRTVARTELPFAIGRYDTSRYSLVRAEPLTGRMHQIRRHFAHLSHPLIGDTVYGDGKHNRLFRDQFSMRALFLKAYSLELAHPLTCEPLFLRSRWNALWLKVFDLFGTCPY
jgi:tRNA pseudouridine65 synthase